MADKILEVIMRITNVGEKKASFGKILADLSKSDDGMGSWSLESSDKVLKSMICENAIELVDG